MNSDMMENLQSMHVTQSADVLYCKEKQEGGRGEERRGETQIQQWIYDFLYRA